MSKKLENEIKDNPRLEQRKLSDGRISLFLEYYIGRTCEPVLDEYGNPVLYETGKMKGKPKTKITHNRKKEYLDLYLWDSPRNPLEREHNKKTIELAVKIKSERQQKFLKDKKGYCIPGKKELFTLWTSYIDKSKVVNKHLLYGALNDFRNFLKEDEEYSMFAGGIRGLNLSHGMMEAFADFLRCNHRGTGVSTYWKRFKTLVNYAISTGDIPEEKAGICHNIDIKDKDDTLTKDILSSDELQQLFACHYVGESETVRRAFALTALTGLRHCDLRHLQWRDIDFASRKIRVQQKKVEKSSSASLLDAPLSESALACIGQKPDGAKATDLVFPDLPTIEGCLKALRHWTKRAGISKHITWHCGRHSFATIMLSKGANIKVVSDLLGHSSLKYTERYVRALDQQKVNAVNSLPEIHF